MGSILSCDITKLRFFVSRPKSTFRASASLSAVFAFAFALWALTSAGGEPTTRERRHANGDSDVNERERDFADGPPVSLAVAGGVFGGLLTSTAALLAAVVVK